jgi:hypothetical protein
VNRIVPLRTWFLAADTATVKFTVTVQVAFAARVALVQVSAPAAVAFENVYPESGPPPATATAVTVTDAVDDVFLSVTTPVPLVLGFGRLMFSGFGVIDTLSTGATPAPVRFTGVPVTVAPGPATVKLPE